MNWETRFHTISGRVLDVGAGQFKKYHELIIASGATIECVDQKDVGAGAQVDIDIEVLPYSADTFDTIILFNILEHTFEYLHVCSETHRILKEGGEMIGFVPFLVRYHPDPHDFFRYTNEALERIIKVAGYKNVNVRPLGRSFIAVQFHTVSQYLPPWVNVLVYPPLHLIDTLLVRARPQMREWYPLGYFFTAKK
jgi:SAM-dependent methyltransferase